MSGVRPEVSKQSQLILELLSVAGRLVRYSGPKTLTLFVAQITTIRPLRTNFNRLGDAQ
jgi:hypothetical protein